MKKLHPIVLPAGIALGLAALMLFAWNRLDGRVEYGIDQPVLAGFPATISHASFYRDHYQTSTFACEFAISEADFAALARDRNWVMRKSDAGVGIARFTNYLPANHPDRQQPFYVVCSGEGLFFEQVQPNGSAFFVYYDPSRATAFITETKR